MTVSAALAADLRALTDALGEPGTDIETVLRALGEHARVAVAAYLGFTLSMVVDGTPVTMTVLGETVDHDPIASSVLVPLSTAGSTIVFYAARTGAFVDLAADLSWTLGLPLPAIELDAHLEVPAADAGLTGLTELSEVNQAIGILIGGGLTPARARTELQRRADGSRMSMAEAARAVIAEATNRTD